MKKKTKLRRDKGREEKRIVEDKTKKEKKN